MWATDPVFLGPSCTQLGKRSVSRFLERGGETGNGGQKRQRAKQCDRYQEQVGHADIAR